MEGYGRVVAGSGMVLWKPCKDIKHKSFLYAMTTLQPVQS